MYTFIYISTITNAMKQFILVISFLFTAGICFAQGYSNERIYVQTNKTVFVAGETIWLKAYLFSKFSPDDVYTTLYFDLTDSNGTVITHKKQMVLDGIAICSIDIPAELSEGVLEIRAYPKKIETLTGTGNYYSKKIYVLNPTKSNNQPEKLARVYSCNFFTGSGKLVAGLNNTVSFKATDQFGQAIAISGTLYNSKQQALLTCKDVYNGMGRFGFVPEKNETYAVAVNFPDGKLKRFPLPSVTDEGALLSVSAGNQSKIFSIQLSDQWKHSGQATIAGLVDNTVVFQKSFSMANGFFSAAIPVAELPASVMKLVVTDAQKQTIATSSTFIKNETSFLPVSITTDRLQLTPKGKNIFTLSVPDSVIGNCSVSITDYDREAPIPQNNILSALLVTQEKNCPPGIFDYAIQKELPDSVIDIILSTSQCTDITSSKKEVQNIADTDFINISGKVFYKKNDNPVSKGELNMIFSTVDSNTTVINAPISNDGSFQLKKLVYYGMGTFRYKLNNKKDELIYVKLDSTIMGTPTPPPVVAETFVADPYVFTNPTIMDYAQKIYRTPQGIDTSNLTLTNVTVTASKASLTQQVNKRYTRGLFENSATAKVVNLINEPPGTGGNIFDYLQSKIAGLMITGVGNDYSIRTTRGFSLSGFAPIRIYLNEFETNTSFIVGIPLQEIALVKYYPPGNSQLPGIGAAGVLAIYTKKNEDVPASLSSPFTQFRFPGYSVSKDFVTDYIEKETAPQIDNRTAIYWNPYLVLNGTKKEYTLNFTNSTQTKRLHVVVEGFTVDGRLIYLDKIIE